MLTTIRLRWTVEEDHELALDATELRAALAALAGDDADLVPSVLDAAALRDVHEGSMQLEAVLAERESDQTSVATTGRQLTGVYLDDRCIYTAQAGWLVRGQGVR